MGLHKSISYDKFPRQGRLLGKQVKVAFHYQTKTLLNAVCVRDDVDEPYKTIFQLEDGRFVLATECQYTF